MGVGTPPKGAGHYNQITDDIGLSENMRGPTSIWETLVKVSGLNPIKKDFIRPKQYFFLQAILDFSCFDNFFPGNFKRASWRDPNLLFP